MEGWIGVRLDTWAKDAMQRRAKRQGLKMAMVVRRIIERAASDELEMYPESPRKVKP